MLKSKHRPLVKHVVQRFFTAFTPIDYRAEVHASSKLARVPLKLINDKILSEDSIIHADVIEHDHIYRVHELEYAKSMLYGTVSPKVMRDVGIQKWSPELVDRITRAQGGTFAASLKAVLDDGRSFNLAGGSHHAKTGKGSGFCIFNDIIVSAEALRAMKLIKNYLVIDLDVHQGDGTAQMARKYEHAYTFSMHCASNFPFVKEQSNWDIELPDGTQDQEYLEKLEYVLFELRQLHHQMLPYDIVYYQAGVDVLQHDRLGRLSLSLQGVRERDSMVFNFCKEMNVPVVAMLGGGYSNGDKHHVDTITEAHCNTVKLMKDMYQD
jgi:acetoin utilization deacetylase AcuC-like enzyme